MPLARLQAILKHNSGLPRDNVTNTFWADTGANALTEAYAESLAEAVRDFYVVDPGAAEVPLMNLLSGSIGNLGHEVKVAPIVEATGVDARGLEFPPLWTEVFDLLGRVVDPNPEPSEVACCLSYKNLGSGVTPPARKRGRIYFGPVGRGATFVDGAINRPSASLQASLLGAANDLQAAFAALGSTWVVYSRPYEGRDEVPRPGNPRGPLPPIAARVGTTFAVTDFWVDNGWDTMRKRGERATARVLG